MAAAAATVTGPGPPSSSSPTRVCWQAGVARALRRRNAAEAEAFHRIVECYAQVCRQQAALASRVERQEKELVILRHEVAQAAAAEDEAGGPGGGEGGAGARDDKLVKLQRKVQRLQEELTEKLRLEVQGATSQLNLTKEVQDYFQKWQAARAEADALKAEVESYRSRERELVATAAIATTDLEAVQAELGRVRAMLDAAEQERTALRQQNEELVQRVVGEKSRNAEEMNRMTELVEQMRAQLRAQGVHVGSGSGSGSGSGTAPHPATEDRSSYSRAEGELPASGAAPSQSFKAHAADVNDLAFNETGQLLATAGSDGKVRVWEAGTGRLRATLQGADVMLGCDLRGDLAACGSSDHTCKLWSVATARAHRTLVGHSGNVYAVRLVGTDGRTVLTGAADRTIRLWDVGRASCKQVLRSGSTCNGLDVSLDGTVPVSAHQDGGLRLWDLRAGNPTMIIRAFETQATSVAYGQGFAVLANSRDNVLKVIDTRTFETLHTLRHEEYRTFLNWSRACFSPSNAHVAAGSATGSLLVWEVGAEEVRATLTSSGQEASASASAAAAARLSLSSSGGGSGPAGGITGCAWASGGGGVPRLAACTKGGHVHVWAPSSSSS